MINLEILFALDSILLASLIILAGILIYIRNKTRLLDYFIAILLASGVSEMIKYHIAKPRPESTFLFEGSSFPSTHSATAAAIVFFYILACHTLALNSKGEGEASPKKRTITGWVIVAFLLIVGGLVAWLRVILGAHYPIDVFAGILLGFLVALLFRFYDIKGRRIK